MEMNDTEIEQKIKQYRSKLQELTLEVAKNEERLKTKDEERQKILSRIQSIYPDFTEDNLEVEMDKLKNQLEADMTVFEMELYESLRKIEANK